MELILTRSYTAGWFNLQYCIKCYLFIVYYKLSKKCSKTSTMLPSERRCVICPGVVKRWNTTVSPFLPLLFSLSQCLTSCQTILVLSRRSRGTSQWDQSPFALCRQSRTDYSEQCTSFPIQLLFSVKTMMLFCPRCFEVKSLL